MKTRGLFVVLFGLAATACSAPTVPSRPSWDEDVFPILQGSCNHCHGETVGRLTALPVGRLDFCDPTPFVSQGITEATAWLGAKLEGVGFAGYVRSVGGRRPQMPPPPAAELTDYEADILVKWGMSGDADKCNKQGRNRDPDMRFIGEPEWMGNDLHLTIDVWDPDRDQVFGKVTVGTASALIRASGRREVVVVGAQQGMPISVMLMDGHGEPKTFTP